MLGGFPGGPVRLRVAISDGGICKFSYAIDDHFEAAPESFQATAGSWIGAKVGIYSLRRDSNQSAGNADFKYFRVLPKPETA